MITLNIDIDYKRKEDSEEKISNPELTLNYIEYAVSSVYEKGLEGQMRRIWGRIQRKLDNALDNKEYVISLEIAELDFLKKAFKEAKIPAPLVKYMLILEDILEELKDESKG